MDEFEDFSHEDDEIEDGVVTNYLVIYEVADRSTFERSLKVKASAAMTPWLAEGMIKSGVELMENEGILEYYE